VMNWLLDQVDQPHRTGVPLAEREQVQAMIADSATELYGARAALYAAAGLTESGSDAEVETAIAKSLASEMVARVVDRAIQLTGGAAVVEGPPLERLYREVRGWRIAEGTTEILRLSIARGLLARHRESGADGSA
jgi:alkylation response protein AidB-like acyl-CoA dehydrogenase